jgi:hypothetical protein
VRQGAATLKEMRRLHTLFLPIVFLEAYCAEQIARATTVHSKTFLGVMIFLAFYTGLQGFYFRRKRLLPALEKLHRDPNDARALNQWRGSIVINLCLASAIAVYGIVLRFMGAGRRVSWPFFVSALILMLVWRPQLDLRGEASNTGIAQ